MIRVIGDEPAITRDVVSLIQGAGGEDATAGLPAEDEPMPSLMLAYGLEAIKKVSDLCMQRGEPFQPVMGLVRSMDEAEEARVCGVTDVVFYPTGREELLFRAVRIMGDSVFRLGDAVAARHLMRFLIAWSQRYDAPFSMVRVSCPGSERAVGRDVALDLMINLRLSDHLCRLSDGTLLVLMPETSREHAEVAVERLRRKVAPEASCELQITFDGGRFGHLTAEELLERL
jgi:hypothetical protein